MKTIKFSHPYKKLLDENNHIVKTAKLLVVSKIRIELFPSCFLDYDTENGLYELPKKGQFIIMFFLKPGEKSSNIFSTIRRYTEQKYSYYWKAISEEFKIELLGDHNAAPLD